LSLGRLRLSFQVTVRILYASITIFHPASVGAPASSGFCDYLPIVLRKSRDASRLNYRQLLDRRLIDAACNAA
jgi:hypothetical protein